MFQCYSCSSISQSKRCYLVLLDALHPSINVHSVPLMCLLDVHEEPYGVWLFGAAHPAGRNRLVVLKSLLQQVVTVGFDLLRWVLLHVLLELQLVH